MTATALGLVLASSVLHASWNLLAKRAGGGAVLVWMYGSISALLLTPAALYLAASGRLPLAPSQWTYVVAGGVIHVVYFVVLQRGYRVGDLSVIYPVARGSSPVLTTAAAIVLLGERPSGLAILGAILVALSVLALAAPARASAGPARRAVGYGLATGVLIALYSTCDKEAVDRLGVAPLIQQWGSSLALATSLAPLAVRRRDEVRAKWRSHKWDVVGIGVLVPVAYLLVLAAMQLSPLSYVAPTREVGILAATLMGTHVLSESQSRRRIAAALGMVAGILALALG